MSRSVGTGLISVVDSDHLGTDDPLRRSEEPFRLLVNGVKGYAIILLDPSGRIVTWNEGARRLKGYNADEIIGQSMERFYPAEAIAAGTPTRLLSQAATHGRSEDEGWRLRNDGTRFFADVIITAIRDSTGGLVGFAKITRNISERKQAEEALRLSEERFRLLINGAKDYAIIMLDPNGKILTWNEGTRRLKGYSAADIVGHSMEEFYPVEAIAAGLPARLLATAAAEGRCEDEGWRVRKDGTRFFANVVLTVVHDGAGKLAGFAKITRDITERKEAEQTLRLSEERFRLLVNAAKDYAMIMLDPNGRIVTWNEGARRLKGYTAAEIVGRSMEEFYPEEAIEACLPARLLAKAAAEGRCEDEGWRVRKDGTRFFADVVLTAVHDEAGALAGFAKITRDITERKEIQEILRLSVERYRMLAEYTTDVIMLVGPDSKRLYMSPACRDLFGYAPEELTNRPVGELVHPDDRVAWAGIRHSHETGEEVVTATFRCIRKDGSLVWVESIRKQLPRGRGYVASMRDVTARKEAQDQLAAANRQLHVLAMQDGLTGLANRRYFDETLETEFRRATREKTTLGLIMIDIDYFKRFNDRYGHPAGDGCLRAVAQSIRDTMQRPGDIAARYGGEEFVVLMPNTSEAGAATVAQRILEGVRGLQIEHEDSPQKIVTISLGVAATSAAQISTQTNVLTEDADRMLYAAKAAGRNRVCPSLSPEPEGGPPADQSNVAYLTPRPG